MAVPALKNVWKDTRTLGMIREDKKREIPCNRYFPDLFYVIWGSIP